MNVQKQTVCFLATLFAIALSAMAELSVTALLFSTDGGKMWTDDPPILKSDSLKFKLKVVWSGRESRPVIYGGLVNATVLSEEADFASSNKADASLPPERQKRTCESRRTGYLQECERGVWMPNSEPFVFDMDLGMRGEGVNGLRNVETPKGPKNGPLPLVPVAHGPGNYTFAVTLYYRLTVPLEQSEWKDKRLIVAEEWFDVLIEK